MKKNSSPFILMIVVTIIGFFTLINFVDVDNKSHQLKRVKSSSSPKANKEMKKARWEYFNQMLRDPLTNKIPDGIRQKELAFANELEKQNKLLRKSSSATELEWKEAGPSDVGGRTRALAVDITNPSTIIAGGASGGIWKSTDNGNSWTLKSSLNTILSVTSIAQDPRPGHTNVWYYSTGEMSSNLAGTQATSFSGDGIYKSVDNGETWNVIQSTLSNNVTRWDSYFDYVDKIEVSKTTGTVFVASRGVGIFRSNDGGNNFSLVLGGVNEHVASDISVASDGTIVAVISSPFSGTTPQNEPGVYKSTDDGVNWTQITVNSFPATHYRNIVEIAPSNTNIAYVISFTGEMVNNSYEDVKFHKINIENGNSEDRSENLPVFNGPSGEEQRVNTQSGYNMTLAIKPDDENFVMIGTTDLFRSTDGFATKPTNAKLDWIGGYHETNFSYPNFHSDVHSFAFSPTNPNAMWWGHDGGLTYTSDITNTNYNNFFPWENKNNGYNVTQFYHISISNQANDNRIMGGTQDNGTPFFVFNTNPVQKILDVSSGDGAFSYFGTNYAYTSSQNGRVLRLNYDNQNNISWNNWSDITPKDASNQYFINPFVVDPNDEDIMYYPAGNTIWRNNQLSNIPNFEQKTTEGWTKLDNISVPTGYGIFALQVSTTPAHILYFSGSSSEGKAPKIYKLNNSNTATNGAVEISIPNAPAGSYVKEISVNPLNGNEIFVVLSNYNIVGLYHSLDGGQTYTAVEGNLVGTEQNPGPSLRSATFLTKEGVTKYFLGTSVGVFSTEQLNGSNTVWTQEGQNVVGNVIVSSITSRNSDGRIVAGTHGRGAFVANINTGSSGTAVASVNKENLTLQSNPGQTGSTSFVLSNTGSATLNYSISVNGSFNNALQKESEVKYFLNKADKETIDKNKKRRELRQNKKIKTKPGLANISGNDVKVVPNNIAGNDILFLDDGNDGSDDFFGYEDGSDLFWYNEFNVSGFNYELDAFQFFMRTGEATSNLIEAAIYDALGNPLSSGELSLGLAPSGAWFEVTLTPAIPFNDGDTFFIEIASKSSIPYPAGADFDALVKNKSSYYNWGTSEYNNLNTIAGFENGAFLIRAVGTKSNVGGNQKPVAIATVSKTEADVNETISFDASQSSDSDGQITQYLWDFGDGSTSTEKIATHKYTLANTYNYSLTVTDNNGATGQTSGQIIINGESNNYVTVNPANGSITPGGSQNITVSLNAENLQVGNYSGQVIISTNGGNIVIPIDYLVDVEQISELPTQFSLSQNYPNPFNPSTVIEFSIPQSSKVSLKVYDMLGREILNLIDEQKSAGQYKVNLNASALSSGIYLYKLVANNYSETKKMMLLK